MHSDGWLRTFQAEPSARLSGAVFDPSQGLLTVSDDSFDSNFKGLLAYDPRGNGVFEGKTEGQGQSEGQFLLPYGVRLNSAGQIMAGDLDQARIQFFQALSNGLPTPTASATATPIPTATPARRLTLATVRNWSLGMDGSVYAVLSYQGRSTWAAISTHIGPLSGSGQPVASDTGHRAARLPDRGRGHLCHGPGRQRWLVYRRQLLHRGRPAGQQLGACPGQRRGRHGLGCGDACGRAGPGFATRS